jgi:hypothetical protein
VPVHPRRAPALAAAALAVAAGALAVPSSAAQPAAAVVAAATVPELAATPQESFDAFDAKQAVAVDKGHFYAIDNSTITKHDRKTGEARRHRHDDAPQGRVAAAVGR